MSDSTDKNSTALRGTRKGKKKNLLPVLLLLAGGALLVIILIRDCNSTREKKPSGTITPVVDTIIAGSADSAAEKLIDSSAIADSIAALDTSVIQSIDTVEKEKEPLVEKKAVTVVPKDTAIVTEVDTASVDTVSPDDTGSVSIDTLSDADTAEAQVDSCSEDTTALWVYPDPSGGLHRSTVRVRFIANRSARVQYRTKENPGWQVFDGTPVPITMTTTLYYDAIDSCGKVMERRSEYYEIRKEAADVCNSTMVAVKVGEMHFCIDRYEWPNRKGVRPDAFVSYYQAGDSCYSAGKRLCTAEEWAMACCGPYSYKYPYGSRYEQNGCTTLDTVVSPAGEKPECRSYFGAYDMSGNLLEWTSTRAAENSSFYYVMGGFWESGPKSGCFDKRYSYYPQNQHNPVGFRCCKDVTGNAGSTEKGARR